MRLVFILGLTSALNVVSFAQNALLEGNGRDEVMAMCNSCHGLEAVTKQRDGKKGWERMVNEIGSYFLYGRSLTVVAP